MYSFDFLSTTWILAASAAFFSGFIRGVSGFAQNLVLAPILLLFLDARAVVVICLLLSVLASFILLPWAWKGLEWSKLIPLIIASLLGIPLGAYIIKAVSPLTLKMFISWLVIAFAIPLAFGITLRLKREKLAAGSCGFVSGLLSSSTSLGGPPVVLFMHNQKWRKDTIYATLNVYFLVLGAASLGFLALFLENIGSEIYLGGAYMVPSMLLGLGIGRLIFSRINVRLFRFLSVLIVIAAGIAGVLSGLGVF